MAPLQRLQLLRTGTRWSRCSDAGRASQMVAQPVTQSRACFRARPFALSLGSTAAIRAVSSPTVRPAVWRMSSSQRPGPDTTSEPLPLPPSRWLADLRSRVGRCIMFGCSAAQVAEAAVVARALATEWRRLTAGSEGYLTGERRGLEGQKVVWGEMDSFAHVNNVVYARYAESSRVNWINHIALHVDPVRNDQWKGLMQADTIGLIMKSLTTEFKFPMAYPDAISVYHRLRVLPDTDSKSTSLLLDCVVLSHSHKRIAARLYEDVSFYDYRTASKTQMPEFVHKVLTDVWRQQQQETSRTRARIWELVAAVERLEKQTWDREDATEDLGAAAI